MKIKVLQKHIDEGNRFRHCPIYLAIVEEKQYYSVSVGLFSVSIFETVHKVKEYGLPTTARMFIHLFDTKGPTMVEPLEFELEFMHERNN